MGPTEKKHAGRPPEGLGKHGEPVKIRDYPKLLITMRSSVKTRLKAIAKHEGRPAWKVVEDALALYIRQLPTKDRRSVEARARLTGR
jgi:hypothetical protein